MAEQFFAQRSRSIFLFVNPSTLEFRNQEADNVFVSLRHDYIRKIETVDIRFFDPLLKQVGYLGWRSDHDGAAPAKSDKFGNVADLPTPVRVACRERFKCRLVCIRICRTQLLIEVENTEIDSGPARHQR